jgi:hypothetical protein
MNVIPSEPQRLTDLIRSIKSLVMKHLANHISMQIAPLALAALLVPCFASPVEAEYNRAVFVKVDAVVPAPVQPVPAAAPPPRPAAPAAAVPAVVPAAAPAAAPPKKKEKSVVPNNAKQTQTARRKKLGALIWYPTIYPNPLAFNMAWVTVSDRTFSQVRVLATAQKLKTKRAAVVVRAQPKVPALNGIQQQMRRFLEPMLKTELSFAIRAADLNDAERVQLITDGKTWFDGFLTDYLKKLDPNRQQMILQGMQGVWFGNQRERPESPRDLIQQGLAKLIKEKLPAGKAAAYDRECKLRADFARRTAVDNTVERIDEKVRLSPDQWKKITKTLKEHWDKNRDPQLEAFAMNHSMWPGAPDQLVLPELTTAQQAVLRRVNQYSGQMFIGGGIFGQMFGGDNSVIDDIDLDNPKPAARAHAPTAQPAVPHSEAE